MSFKSYEVKDDDDDIRLDRWFKRHESLVTNSALQKALRKGDVKLNGKKVEAKTRLKTGDVIKFHISLLKNNSETKRKPQKEIFRPSERQISETLAMVIEETNSAIIINKPAGLAVQGGSGIKDSVDARLDILKDKSGSRPKLTHRIDKDTSGVLLLAKNAKAATRYTQFFKDKSIQKIYWALIMGVPEIKEGTIDLRLLKHGEAGNEKVIADESGKRAITHYRVIDVIGSSMSWVEMVPVTGRTHQLRAHMSEIGHPIAGDGKYGGRAAFPSSTGLQIAKKLHLHAKSISLKDEFTAIAPLPKHMQESFELLGFDEKNAGA